MQKASLAVSPHGLKDCCSNNVDVEMLADKPCGAFVLQESVELIFSGEVGETTGLVQISMIRQSGKPTGRTRSMVDSCSPEFHFGSGYSLDTWATGQ
ncbi:hypothetical protein N7468_010685 [Penicillium chermesinum]|uniref:Uncharacterized protein n=1 Tax=Penicillium chermesinum TaxID=63820 RepID=A0A9W9N871_9EURO|nr:uncharacterized protein N7468_010685 [Penicillium chermesinum]KAJ5215006.1 hypothetical protein N7468_010685 [Penicillium chermesinum]